MDTPTLAAFIVTRSIPLADGLEALLRAIPRIDEVKVVKTLKDAYEQIERETPHIVLVDLVLTGNQPEETLEKIVSLSPETQRVLLVDDIQDVRWMPQFEEAVLVKGVSPSAVAAIVTSLLFSKGDAHERNDPNP
jgi:DNA-binding NarL/FixJ family response regulator